MLITCWSVKGGSGTTVVAASLALLAAEASGDAWIVDLGGDQPGALGLAEPSSPGVGDWLAAPEPLGADALARLAVPVTNGLGLIPRGALGPAAPERWRQLAEALADAGRIVIVDAGSSAVPEPLRGEAVRDVLVVRPCYLAMRRAALVRDAPTDVVMVSEPGRALKRPDVERIAGAPVTAEISWDPDVARSVDAGLLAGRLPRAVRVALADWAWLPA